MKKTPKGLFVMRLRANWVRKPILRVNSHILVLYHQSVKINSIFNKHKEKNIAASYARHDSVLCDLILPQNKEKIKIKPADYWQNRAAARFKNREQQSLSLYSSHKRELRF